MSETGIADGIAKVLNAVPTSKLISTVSAGIGKLYEPRHKRKMAEATAYEISVIGEAMRNAADMPIVYDQNGVAINSEDFKRLMQRAGTRLVLQETVKQHNIESVIDNAYELLEKEEVCSDEPVEQGWMNRFFDTVADISDEDLQKLWGKVLAGEIKQPKSYSLRTLETLKNLSKHEAELFHEMAPYVITFCGSLFLTSNKTLLEKYEIKYVEIMAMDECGLINSSGVAAYPLVSNEKTIELNNRSKVVLLHGLKKHEEEVSIEAYVLTKAGEELYNIMTFDSNDEYFYDFVEKTQKDNSEKVTASIHQINSFYDDEIDYEEKALYEFPVQNVKSSNQE